MKLYLVLVISKAHYSISVFFREQFDMWHSISKSFSLYLPVFICDLLPFCIACGKRPTGL